MGLNASISAVGIASWQRATDLICPEACGAGAAPKNSTKDSRKDTMVYRDPTITSLDAIILLDVRPTSSRSLRWCPPQVLPGIWVSGICRIVEFHRTRHGLRHAPWLALVARPEQLQHRLKLLERHRSKKIVRFPC